MNALRRAAELAVIVLALVALTPFTASAQDAEPLPPIEALDRLAECVSTKRHVAVALLIDESGSLSTTDPEATRVDAVKASLQALRGLVSAKVSGETPQIDVRVAGFSNDVAWEGPWTPLSATGDDGLDEVVEGFTDRDQRMDTDYYNAVVGASDALEQRALDLGQSAPKGVCKVALWFTDGGYLLGQRQRSKDVEEYGTEKSYAPDVSLRTKEGATEARDIGLRKLCAPNGPVDRLRKDGVFDVAVAIRPEAAKPDTLDPDAFLDSLMTGKGAGDAVCGAVDGSTSGAYLPVDDVSSLVDRFLRLMCNLQGCVITDQSPFTVDRAFGHGVIHLEGDAGDSFVLTSPTGETFAAELGEDEDGSVGSVGVTAEAFGDGALVTLAFDQSEDDHLGEWTIEGSGPGDLEATVVLFIGVFPAVPDDAFFEAGKARSIDVTIVDGEDRVVPAADIDGQLVLSAEVIDPETGERAPAEVGPVDAEGHATLTYTADPDSSTGNVRLAIRLGGTAGGDLPLTETVRTFPIPVVKDASLPRILTDEIVFPPMEKGREGHPDQTTVTGEVELLGSDVSAGRACASKMAVKDAPPRLGGLTLAPSCVDVPKGKRVVLPVEISGEDLASGPAAVRVTVDLSATSTGAKDSPKVPGTVQLYRGVDIGRVVWVVVVILAASVLIPLGVLWAWSWWTSRFHDEELFLVRCVHFPMRIRNGVVEREDGEPGPLVPTKVGGAYLTAADTRSATIPSPVAGGSDLVVKPKPHLFTLPTAVVSGRTGGVVGSEGLARRTPKHRHVPRGVVRHSVFGSWVFAIDSASPSVDGEVVDATGDLYVLVYDEHQEWESEMHGLLADASVMARIPSVVKAVDRFVAAEARADTRPHDDGSDGPGPDGTSVDPVTPAPGDGGPGPTPDPPPAPLPSLDDFDV